MIRIITLVLAGGLVTDSLSAAEPALKFSQLDGGVVCVQVPHVTGDISGQIQAGLTNKLSGLVLDLRFTNGDKMDAPVALPQCPLVLLVNGDTRGAAADWARQLRPHSKAIVIGSTNGSSLVIPDIVTATSGEEEKQYQLNPYAAATSEKPQHFAANSNFLPFIDHTSEAELVRRRVKDGEEIGAETPRSAPPQPVIHDPALARAVDLLKALAVLKPARG
jgi:hypothetical protein